jgi:hypothetical protein
MLNDVAYILQRLALSCCVLDADAGSAHISDWCIHYFLSSMLRYLAQGALLGRNEYRQETCQRTEQLAKMKMHTEDAS